MTTAIPSTSSAVTSSVFEKLDAKNQGFIEKAELTTAFKDAGANGLDVGAIDSDKDGKITKSEMTAGAENLVAQLESSALSSISSSEGAASTSGDAVIADSRISTDAAPKEAASPPPSKKESPIVGEASSSRNYEAADTNKDGEVSVKEAVLYAAAQEAKTQETKAATAKQEQTSQYNVAQAMQAYAYNAGTVENQVSTSA